MPSDRPGTATDEVAFSTRTPGPSRLRVAAVAGAGLILAAGAVATSLAASPPPSGAATPNDPVSGTVLAPLPGLAGDELELDHGGFGRHGFGEITISAISGSNVTLETDDGWTRTVAVNGTVDVTKGGQDIAVSDLAVGDQVRLGQTRNADGSYTVNALAVVVPGVRGEVSDVTSNGFKVTARGGAIWTIAVNAATGYQFGTGAGSLADVTNGAIVVVLGTSTGDNSLTALTVRVKADRAIGTVTAKTADSITIRTRGGETVTVHVDGETSYRVAGVETADLDDVAVDMAIGVSGRTRADGSIDADVVAAGAGRRFLRGGRGGFGGFEEPALGPAGLGLPDLDVELFEG